MGLPWESHEKCRMDGMGQHTFPMGPKGQQYITELPQSEAVDEQEIQNLLNEHNDSEYECQNDNELWTLLNFKVNKANKFCRFASLFVRVALSSAYYILKFS